MKKLCEQVERTVPGWSSPWRYAPEAWRKKLGRNPKTPKKRALNRTETKRLVKHLRKERNIRGRQRLGVVLLLLGTGLQAAEACAVRWRNVSLDEDDGTWRITWLVAKGGKPIDTLEVMLPEALEIARKVFKQQHRRDPGSEDHLVYVEPKLRSWTWKSGPNAGVRCAVRRSFTPGDLWSLLQVVGRGALGAKVTTRELIWSPHMLRRTAASILAKSAASIIQVARHLRHSNIATTLRHYTVDEEPNGPILRKALAAA